jgi:hypothetical protein
MRVAGAIVACLSFSLAGCTLYGWEKRHGIDPILDPAAVEIANANHIRILTALARDANLVPSTPGDWYPVAEAGFNYIDDECRLYFNHLFFLNREKEQLKSGIIAAAATTAAILGVTGASSKSMTVVAEAFGFGSIATDLIAGTYLYQLPPATTQGFVKEMQLAYREGVAIRRAEITTPTTAYHAIQAYLALCLPPTIEAKIAEHVATARAFPDPATNSGSASFGITLTSPPPTTRPAIRAAVGADVPPPRRPTVIRDVNEPQGKIATPKPTQSATRLGVHEPRMSSKDMRVVLDILCRPKSETDLGPAGSPARKALAKFLADNGKTSVEILNPDAFSDILELSGKRAC